MYLSILIYPLLNYICCGMLGRFFGRRGAYCLSVFFLGFSFIFSSIAFYSIIKTGFIVEITLFKWASFDSLMFSCTFLYDSISCVMLFVVTSISFLVHIYSGFYMEDDPYLPKFLSFLSLFTFFMLFYVLSGNFFQLFLGWEGIGLCSYLLINFWHTRTEANKSAIKAVIINKIGDFGFFFGIILCVLLSKGADFSVVYPTLLVDRSVSFSINILGYQLSCHAITLICFFFLIGVVGKSAQVGLHMWLPDAMEGPTPVSALIHAATMVTAGVFLIIRTSCLFEQSPLILSFLIIIGALTAFFSGTIALFQFDLKKVIAYSTCSQLGYMVLSCGLSGYDLALFHLFNHAFFKALLFLSSGIIIHFFKNEQDIRRYGFVFRVLPFVFYSMLIGSLSLMGIPYLSGFYSKDKILELAFYTNNYISFIGYFFGIFAAFLTAAYSSRLLYLIFFFSLDQKPFFYAPKIINKRYFFKQSFLKPNNYIFFQNFIKLNTFQFWQNLLFVKVPSLLKIFFLFDNLFSLCFMINILFIDFYKNNKDNIVYNYMKFLFYSIINLNKFFQVWFILRLDFFLIFTAPIESFFFNIVFILKFLIFKGVNFYLSICSFFSRVLKLNLFSFISLLLNEYLILFPLIILLFGSIFSGYVFYDLFLGVGSPFFDGSIFTLTDMNFNMEMYNINKDSNSKIFNFCSTRRVPGMIITPDSPFLIPYNIYNLIGIYTLPSIVKLLPLFFSIFGFFFIPFCYDLVFTSNLNFLNKLNKQFFFFFIFFNKKWFFDNLFLSLSLGMFSFFFKLLLVVDKGFLEQFGPRGLIRCARFFSKIVKGSQSGTVSGYLQNFLFFFLIFLLIFFFFFYF